MTYWCTVQECWCPKEKDGYIVAPTGKDYVENMLNIAEYYSGTRSWDFFRKDYKEIQQIVKEDWENRIALHGFNDESTARRAQYMTTPEAQIVIGVWFCLMQDTVYGILKDRLSEAVCNNTVFSLDDEWTRVRDLLVLDGYTASEIRDMTRGWRDAQPVIARILIMSTEGAERCISISECRISAYFPELADEQTCEISMAGRI